MADSIAFEYRSESLGVFTSSIIFFDVISLKLISPDFALSDKIFLTDLDSLASDIFPFLYESLITFTPEETLVDIKIMSLPTSKALKSTLIEGS